MYAAVLGPLRIHDQQGRSLTVGRSKERLLLATLLLHANTTISLELITAALWEEHPPRSWRANVKSYISDLRRCLAQAGANRPIIESRTGGYRISMRTDELDVLAFRALADQGQQALKRGEHASAVECLSRALNLWKGPVLERLPVPRVLEPAVAYLDEQRFTAIDGQVAARLALGQHASLIGELSTLTASNRLHERLWEYLMLALYRSGRQAEALAAYRDVHRLLADELAVAPGSGLQRLHQQILEADPALDAPTNHGLLVCRSVAPRQLPADAALFTGRTRELQRLDDLLCHYGSGERPGCSLPIIAMSGMAGVGKTTLAVHWSHGVSDRFRDGQLYVNLHGYSAREPAAAAEVLTAFLRCLGMRDRDIPVDPEEAAATYRSLLAGKRVLVLLDNAASAAQVRPLLPGSHTCLALVTSRDSLTGLVAMEGGHRLLLNPLSLAESTELLSRMLDRGRARTEQAGVALLAKVCGHLPLALRIAGAKLTDQPHRLVGDYGAELAAGNPLDHLEINGDEPVAMRKAFDFSYQSLPPQAQRLFRLLALVPAADFTASTAAALLDVPVEQAANLLETLSMAHLVKRQGARCFAFHDLLRWYAHERLTRHSDQGWD